MNTISSEALDVTLIEPRLKHPTIFARFDKLVEGESLTILNDHDPKPLFYQLLGERGDVFNWEYLEHGPESWKVRVTRKGIRQMDETIGEIVAKDLRKAEVFSRHGLDFCCGGGKTIRQACAEKGIDATKVEQELRESAGTGKSRPLAYDEWELPFLIDHIIHVHHAFVKKTLPTLFELSEKVNKVHGGSHPELALLQELTAELGRELTPHLLKEENILFPYVRAMHEAMNKGLEVRQAHFGSVENPVRMMETEHESAGAILKEIRKLTSGYKVPEDACSSYRTLYRLLQDFEQDLHLHIHLENNILFPKSLKLGQ